MTTTYDWAFVDPTTGNISHIMSIQDNNQISQGQTIDGLKAALIDSSVTHTEAIKKTYWDYDTGTWGVREPPPSDYAIWTNTKTWEINRDLLMSDLRRLRNLKLEASDWTQLGDNQLTDEKKADWVTYRQALRDITKNVADDTSTLENFAWPSEPS